MFGTAASCLVSDVPLLQAGRDINYQCWPGVREPRSASRELPEGALGPSKLSPDMRGFHGAVRQAGLLPEEMAKGLQEGLCFVSLARKKGLRKKNVRNLPQRKAAGNEEASAEAELGQSTSLQRHGAERGMGPWEDCTQT